MTSSINYRGEILRVHESKIVFFFKKIENLFFYIYYFIYFNITYLMFLQCCKNVFIIEDLTKLHYNYLIVYNLVFYIEKILKPDLRMNRNSTFVPYR